VHIAYFQTWGLGDLVMTVPALNDIRRVAPDGTLTLVVRGGAQRSLLQDDPLVDRVLNMPAGGRKRDMLRFFRGLRRQRFDVAFIGSQISPLLPALLRGLSGVQTIVGDSDRAGFLYTVRVPASNGTHRVKRMRNAVAAWSGTPPGPVAFGLKTRDEDRAAADALLKEAGFARGTYMMIHAGSSCRAGADKRIPARVVHRLIAALGQARPELDIGLLFGPDELDTMDAYAPFDTRVAAFEAPPLGVTRSLLAGARVLLGSDSAPGHLAALEGIPTITVVGPTNPRETAPWGARARIFARPDPYPCQPCWNTLRYGNCPFDVRCMKNLPERDLLAMVLDAAGPALCHIPVGDMAIFGDYPSE